MAISVIPSNQFKSNPQAAIAIIGGQDLEPPDFAGRQGMQTAAGTDIIITNADNSHLLSGILWKFSQRNYFNGLLPA